MSGRVRRLDSMTASCIAAGEVIERPASVVKELIENAIDANSKRIDIDLHNGGRRLIQVTDNGCGLHPDDAVLAVQRFTTSKIRCLEDLQSLTTLGFRGEALPSLTVVARVEMYTRPEDRQEGVRVCTRNGAVPAATPVGCPLGTRVCVHDLFSHLPVRLRSLKSISREVQLVQDLVGQYALAHPHITFLLRHDGRRLLFAPACADLMQRLPLVLGRELAAQMVHVQRQHVDIVVHGAVSTPAINRATRQRQYFWINGRPIRSGLLSHAVERGYGALVPAGRHPVVTLGITVSPALIDVNVHPRKTEIKFLHERAVFDSVQEAVETVVQQSQADIAGRQEPDDAGVWANFPLNPLSVAEHAPDYALPPSGDGAQPLRFLGQVGDTFIVAASSQGLVLFDQHAAHERLIYDRLLAADKAGIDLDEPLVLPLTASQQRWLGLLQPGLEWLRFRLEPFGKDTVIVCAVPEALRGELRPGNLIDALHDAQQRITPRSSAEEAQEHLGAALACRAAWRAGDKLNAEQMTTLVTSLTHRRLAYTCPHGRPTYSILSLAELERRFLRFFPLDTSAGGC